jgi:toxin YoeB
VPIFDQAFREDIAWWFKTNLAKANKILDLVSDVMANPFQGIGKPEPIKDVDADTWSRRIDLEHRLIYRVRQDRIDFLACRYHYQ